jgi:hypothetical protein
MKTTTRNRLALVLVAVIVALATYTVASAVGAMFPTNYPASCEVGLLNGTYSECE